ncbi:MAG: type II toxin-antitoxin system VapC family toxin [Candidatus Delongbacteria bacterium]
MILADTSIWIDHFRRGNPQLATLLDAGQILQHQLVLGELMCGNLRNRAEILGLLFALPEAQKVTFDEIARFVEARRLFGRGLGWTDVSLLASAQLTGCKLWTLDKALLLAAAELGLQS